jgi:GT2 family glycosyltransferase
VISIIYVNYNTTELLLGSIASLARLTAPHEIIVVDNDSKDFDPAAITKLFPRVKVIPSGGNLGFGRANNLGASQAKGDYLWILNPDTVLPDDHQMDKLIGYLEAHPQYAAALPLLTDATGTVQPGQIAYFPTPTKVLLNIPIRLAGKLWPGGSRLYGKINRDYLPIEGGDIEVGVGAALVVRRAHFQEVGGFSPEFFMFYEDSDLCRKLYLAGYKVRHHTESHVVHLWGQSITGDNALARRKRLYNQSQDIYFRKWASAPERVVIRVLRWPLWVKYRLVGR